MAIQKNHLVSIHYNLKNDKGDHLDSSEGKDPLSFVYGTGHVIKGLETALADKSEGDSFSVSIPPESAYGTRNPEMLQTVSIDQFEDKESVTIGAEFHVPEDGLFATVTAIQDGTVTLDMNHPLADQTLHFDIDIVAVREATSEELNESSAS